MRFYSTGKEQGYVDFKDATIRGQAPDMGLYFPETIPKFEDEFLKDLAKYSNDEIAFRVIRPYVGNAIPEEKLFSIVKETVNFPVPLVKVREDIYSLELFHGPTMAFKDIGARFMSRCLGYFVAGESSAPGPGKKITVLVATSGDTGGAVANGFYEVPGVQVVILYPSGKVSEVQEKQLTTPGKNISALEIQGSFDDCQRMVKQAFADSDLQKRLFLTSANSINVARWLPQQFYYFFAYKQWSDKPGPPVISVPSGNFGNICAGLLAHCSGLPMRHFIAACNVNDVVTRYLAGGQWQPGEAIPTLSNAMDVGNPSNFIRILELFNNQFPKLRKCLSSYSITDDETMDTIKRVYKDHRYLLDPHGAVGYLSLEKYLSGHAGQEGIFLETAHPAKFPQAVEKATRKKVPVPDYLHLIMDKPKKSLLMQAHYNQLKEYLLNTWVDTSIKS